MTIMLFSDTPRMHHVTGCVSDRNAEQLFAEEDALRMTTDGPVSQVWHVRFRTHVDTAPVMPGN